MAAAEKRQIGAREKTGQGKGDPLREDGHQGPDHAEPQADEHQEPAGKPGKELTADLPPGEDPHQAHEEPEQPPPEQEQHSAEGDAVGVHDSPPCFVPPAARPRRGRDPGPRLGSRAGA